MIIVSSIQYYLHFILLNGHNKLYVLFMSILTLIAITFLLQSLMKSISISCIHAYQCMGKTYWKLDYCLKVDELLIKKNGIFVRNCSKFSVKCEASHKNIVKIYFFNACCLQIGRVGTYRQVLHSTITVYRKLQDKVFIRTNYIYYFCIFKERVPAEPGLLTNPTFLFYGPVQ